MNFKTAISVSSLAIFAAVSTLAVGPAAQARTPCVPFNSAGCMSTKVRNSRFFCPRDYRAVKPEYSRYGVITCVKNSFQPINKVANVDYGFGTFQQRRNGWVHMNKTGAFGFQELGRDASRIYLTGEDGVHAVVIDLQRNIIEASKHGVHHDSTTITKAY